MKLIAFLITSLIASAGYAQFDLGRDFVQADGLTKLLLPPDLVSRAKTNGFTWSPKGRYLVVRRTSVDQRPQGIVDHIVSNGQSSTEDELLSYDTETGKSRVLDHFSNQEFRLSDLAFMASSDYLLLIKTPVSNPGSMIAVAVNVATGAATTIFSGATDDFVFFRLSPTKPIGFVGLQHGRRRGDQDSGTTTVSAFSPSGVSQHWIPVPGTRVEWGGAKGDEVFSFKPILDANGNRLRDANHFERRQAFRVDLVSGQVKEAIEYRAFKPTGHVPAFVVSNIPGNSEKSLGPSVLINSAKPQSRSGIVTTDGNQGQLSPTETAIAYVSLGSTYVRKLTPFDTALYAELQMRQARTAALSQAKQIAMATMMYCADNGDNFPANDGAFGDRVSRYLKSRDLLNGFVYTFGGGNAANIDSPTTTRLGYVSGPGGRAVVYVDGHAKWETNP